MATPVVGTQPIMPASPSDRTLLDLRNACQLLENENQSLRRRLSDAKTALLDREAVMFEENERLRERIRENRKHINILRRASGMPEGSPVSAFSTPYIPQGARSSRIGPLSTPKQARRDQPFAALLLADQVLSQEAATTPSTPAPHQTPSRKRTHRASISVSSIPSTPKQTPRPATHGPYYLKTTPRTHLAASFSPPLHPGPHSPTRRRQSRDSTISASDLEDRSADFDAEPEYSADEADETVSASTAIATTPHRAQPSTPRKYAASTTSQSGTSAAVAAAAAVKSTNLLQSKLYGYQVTKVPGEGMTVKRKFYDDTPAGQVGAPGSPTKKEKTKAGAAAGRSAEGVGLGLGIGVWGGGAGAASVGAASPK